MNNECTTRGMLKSENDKKVMFCVHVDISCNELLHLFAVGPLSLSIQLFFKVNGLLPAYTLKDNPIT